MTFKYIGLREALCINLTLMTLVSTVRTANLEAQELRSANQRASLQIRETAVSIGADIREINQRLGKIYKMTFSNPGEWKYEIVEGYPEARIAVSDGRVTKVTKYINVSGNKTASDRALEEFLMAGQEFRSGISANSCYPPDLQRVNAKDGTVALTQTCGPFTLQLKLFKYPTGELGFSTQIELKKN